MKKQVFKGFSGLELGIVTMTSNLKVDRTSGRGPRERKVLVGKISSKRDMAVI